MSCSPCCASSARRWGEVSGMGLEELETDPMTAMAVEMRFMRLDINEIKDTLRNRPCPSSQCAEHSRRLTELETAAKQDDRHGEAVVAWVGIIIAIASSLIAAYALVGA